MALDLSRISGAERASLGSRWRACGSARASAKR